MACASEYYCGNICEVDEQAGYDMAQGHVRRRLPLHRIPRPTAELNVCHDERVRGIDRFLDEHPDMELATSAWSPFATGVQEVPRGISGHRWPDVDGRRYSNPCGNLCGWDGQDFVNMHA